MPFTISAEYWNYILMVGLILGAALVGLFVQFLILRLIRALSKKKDQAAKNLIVRHLRWPLRFMLPLLFIVIALAVLLQYKQYIKDANVVTAAGYVIIAIFILLAAWLVVKIIAIAVELAEQRIKKNHRENLRMRKIFTQLRIIKRIATVIIMFLAAAVILLQFEAIRTLGATLLASAGVIGIVIGFAAQRSIATLFAGFQIAFSQPIRLDDRVVVENEWGTIEEITLTYVVVRIWDLRRLIVPITYFIEKPFQNLTRTTSDLLGGVILYVDYSIPIAALRAKMEEVVKADPLWNGNVCVLQVTDAAERSLVIRVLVSAADAPGLWDLRCHVREALITWLAAEYPQCLPRLRASLEGNNADHLPGAHAPQ
jgi:small-conductance mechanosensitive channel